MNSFGLDFIVISDVVQELKHPNIGGGRLLHLATVKRGFKEYMAYRPIHSNKVYLTEVNAQNPEWFSTIADDNEFADLVMFLKSAHLLEVGSRREILTSSKTLPGAYNEHKNQE